MEPKVQALEFRGPHDRKHLLRAFFGWLDGGKRGRLSSGCADDPEPLIRSRQWEAFIDDRMAAQFGLGRLWEPEEVIDGILRGHYQLEALELREDGTGTLRFRPRSQAFGGTGPLKALLELYGYAVTHDSTVA